MFTQRLTKIDDEFVVAVPIEMVERNGWQAGQWLDVVVTTVETRPGMGDDFQHAIDERWERNEEALRYLADR